MTEIVLLILLTVAMLGIFIFLYNQGYMVFKAISAVTFIGAAKGNSAKFTSCSGTLKRMIRFNADGTHTFVLDSALTKGDMSVELLDSARQRILLLDASNQRSSVTVKTQEKYCLVIHFRSATGQYTLRRE